MNKTLHSEFDVSAGPVFPPASIPDHELLRCIGRGSYGEVWLARNAVGTPRAVKIVRRDRFEQAADFEREFKGLQCFEPVSRTHEGLSDILSLGRLPGVEGFFYVMELADDASANSGLSADEVHSAPITSPQAISKSRQSSLETYSPLTLRAALRNHIAFSFDRLLSLGLKLTTAVAHLHAEGLVHRDIKPSNILLVGGEPKLADAGLVAAVDDARSLVGTAGYIAPEGPGSPQADIYALGKVLYEAAFGKDRQDFPQLPPNLRLRPNHVGLLEFNAIVLKACATDPRERYQSANQMRGDLELLQFGKSVKRRYTWQRNLTYAKKFALAGAGLIAVLAIVYWSVFSQTRPQDFAWSGSEEANREYSEGVRSLHSGPGDLQAIEHFKRAIAKDPDFADAYARMAFTWLSFSGPTNIAKAREAAERAVALKPTLAAGHAFLASVKAHEFDWAGAEEQRHLSLKYDPNSEEILLESALNLAVMGRMNEALASLEKAHHANADASSNLREIYSGFVYAWAGQYDSAIEIFKQFPNAGSLVKERLAEAYRAKGDYTNAMRLDKEAALGRSEDLKQVNAEFDALEKAYDESEPKRYWRLKLEFETLKTDDNHLMRMAAILARLNRGQEAIEYLFRAKKETPKSFLTGFMTNPRFDTLRDDHRFKEMIDEFWGRK